MKLLHKNYVLIIGSIALLISSCSTAAQTPTATAVPSPTSTAIPESAPKAGDASQLPPDLAYPILLEQVKGSDPTFDFTQLRLTFAQTTKYDPYNVDESDLMGPMYDAYDNNDYEQAIKLANQILGNNYLLPDPHFILLQAYQKLGDQKNADFQTYFLKGLITSISESGNGRSPETAFIVIHFEEEYFLLNILGIQNSTPTFKEENGIPYDIFEGIDESTNEKATIYFDISIPYKWLNNSVPQGQQVPQ